MSTFVLDASVALSWILDDEQNQQADAVLDRLKEDDAHVPQLWHLEVRNALLVAKRRGRVAGNQLAERLEELNRLPVQTDANVDLTVAWSLAQRHELSFYDAVYLELAKRLDAPLITLDAALCRAAANEALPTAESQ